MFLTEPLLNQRSDDTAKDQETRDLRKRLEQQTRQIEKLMYTSPGVICSFRLSPCGKTSMPFASPAIREVYGVSPEEVRDDFSPIARRIHPDDVAEVQRRIELSARTMTPWRMEFRFLHDEKGERWIAGHSSPLRDDDGSLLWHGVIEDVTERHRSDEALRASEQRYRSLFSNMLVGILHGRVVRGEDGAVDILVYEQNAVFSKLTGLKDCAGKRLSELIPAFRSANKPLVQLIGRVASTGVPERVECYSTSFSKWFAVAAHPSAPDGIVLVMDDITERKVAELALTESEQRFNTAFHSSPAALMLARWDRTVVDVNQRFLDATGTEKGDVIGTPASLLRLVPTERIDEIRDVLRTGGIISDFEMNFARKDGTERTAIASVARVELGGEPHLLGAFIDMTERKRAEMEIRKLNAELDRRVQERTADLESANRELESFAYSVSHDLRAPLRAINGYAEMLVEDHDEKLSAEVRRILGVIRDSGRRMSEIIDALLALSRLGRSELAVRAVDMTALVREALAPLARAYPESTVRVDELPPCEGDPSLLRQVWTNLLDNALKYSRPKTAPEVHIGAESLEASNRYFVRDNGVGFDRRYAHKLFGVFQRLHRAEDFAGTGVGLAIVQRIVERHGGTVHGQGMVNEGATFSFTLKGMS